MCQKALRYQFTAALLFFVFVPIFSLLPNKQFVIYIGGLDLDLKEEKISQVRKLDLVSIFLPAMFGCGTSLSQEEKDIIWNLVYTDFKMLENYLTEKVLNKNKFISAEDCNVVYDLIVKYLERQQKINSLSTCLDSSNYIEGGIAEIVPLKISEQHSYQLPLVSVYGFERERNSQENHSQFFLSIDMLSMITGKPKGKWGHLLLPSSFKENPFAIFLMGEEKAKKLLQNQLLLLGNKLQAFLKGKEEVSEEEAELFKKSVEEFNFFRDPAVRNAFLKHNFELLYDYINKVLDNSNLLQSAENRQIQINSPQNKIAYLIFFFGFVEKREDLKPYINQCVNNVIKNIEESLKIKNVKEQVISQIMGLLLQAERRKKDFESLEN